MKKAKETVKEIFDKTSGKKTDYDKSNEALEKLRKITRRNSGASSIPSSPLDNGSDDYVGNSNKHHRQSSISNGSDASSFKQLNIEVEVMGILEEARDKVVLSESGVAMYDEIEKSC